MVPYPTVSTVCDACKILCQRLKKVLRSFPSTLAVVSGDVNFLFVFIINTYYPVQLFILISII